MPPDCHTNHPKLVEAHELCKPPWNAAARRLALMLVLPTAAAMHSCCQQPRVNWGGGSKEGARKQPEVTPWLACQQAPWQRCSEGKMIPLLLFTPASFWGSNSDASVLPAARSLVDCLHQQGLYYLVISEVTQRTFMPRGGV